MYLPLQEQSLRTEAEICCLASRGARGQSLGLPEPLPSERWNPRKGGATKFLCKPCPNIWMTFVWRRLQDFQQKATAWRWKDLSWAFCCSSHVNYLPEQQPPKTILIREIEQNWRSTVYHPQCPLHKQNLPEWINRKRELWVKNNKQTIQKPKAKQSTQGLQRRYYKYVQVFKGKYDHVKHMHRRNLSWEIGAMKKMEILKLKSIYEMKKKYTEIP